ncbi:PREDICTED: uncharacterized protein LOC106748483 isoform X2 [Dinoponera quadriceps]|uniref:Uncharacterized protein LOC106748483 isoform X2 n=1 Tax=Dinoponera quadriceps TaxID=609295 RepID=A0A6P3XX61_DINQU|nr:PREDICTED: uncharacterized protein LOC106748483 isoform X2 [Dinoponera quadriceps]
MVTLQDFSTELTSPIKKLADWKYPFSEALETYYSLFKTASDKDFVKAGLVLQNSMTVYVHRVDCLWNKTTCIRNIFLEHEQEETARKAIGKKRDRRTNLDFENFQIIDFTQEVDRNIDIKKNNVMQDGVKTKNRCFTQLEKSVAQSIPIDIYDINGEIIGKKYDFRCNQNISMNGVLVDEFVAQDFDLNSDDRLQRKSPAPSSNCSLNESLECSPNPTVHDSSEKNISSDVESERDYDDSPGEVSELVSSFDSSKNLSLSSNSMSFGSSADNSQEIDAADTTNGSQCTSLSDTKLPDNTVDSTSLSDENNSNSSNNNNGTNVDGDLLDGSIKSISSRERIKMSIDPTSLDNTNERKSPKDKNNSPAKRHKYRARTKTTLSKRKQKPTTTTPTKKKRVVKNLLEEFEKRKHSPLDRPSMFQKNLNTCMKHIRKHDPLRYDHLTNEAFDLLGFQLHVESRDDANNNITMTLTDDEMSDLHSSNSASPVHESPASPWHESPRDQVFRSDSSNFLPENIEEWHEFLQPKLLEAERRSMFCIRPYASKIMNCLRASDRRKINFSEVIQNENAKDVARYFLASLTLASSQNMYLNMKDLGHDVEIVLPQEDRSSSFNGHQADSHD